MQQSAYVAKIMLCFVLLPIGFCSHSETKPETVKEQQIQALSQTYTIPISELNAAINKARLNPDVLKAIASPFEQKPWFEYYPRFLAPRRVKEAALFLKENKALFKRAEQQFSVPASVIAAILSVETALGRYQGTYSVLDTLYTLGFHYPPRGDFFRRQFAEYILLSKTYDWDLTKPKGSYAGAMGIAQFMPSSYRAYAIDFSSPQDAHVDLSTSVADAIGSVANYLQKHGWQTGQPVTFPVSGIPPSHEKTILQQPKRTWSAFIAQGLRSNVKIAASTPVTLLALENTSSREYWAMCDNFRVIMSYNPRPLYAMAVYQLSEKITREYETAF